MLCSRDVDYIENKIGRKLTDLESACFENLWSEHCSYRSTKPVLRTMPTQGKNVILGPGDDAAIVAFDDKTALAIGMESHNHPSYVDPYDGSATGVGGIVRDVISMGARPIALMDPLYFGPLTEEKNRYLFEHIIAGIGDYGNCIGVPVVRGELTFDEHYSGNPLVNVVCVGVCKPDDFLTARVKVPGSRLVLYGSSTGRDGLGGASFASRDLSEDSEAADRPAVQVGDPYTEKLLIEATLEMAATGKVLSCRDLGAAGLAGASSEMASSFGAKIAADKVHLREDKMNEVEIMLAESQERMLIEVRAEDIPQMAKIIEKYDLKWSDIGEIISEPRYIVTFNGKVVCDLPIDLLVGGTPEENWPKEAYAKSKPFTAPKESIAELCGKIISHPDIASKEWVFRQYDHDVQLRTVSTAGGAACLKVNDSGLFFSCGCAPRQIDLAPHDGCADSVYENAANLAAMGAEPLCVVNCLNFASPVHETIFWQISEAVRGMGDMCRRLDVPVVGGNVSLYNESEEFKTQILPTPSIGMIGKGPVRRFVKPAAGMKLALLGKALSEFGGSLLDCITKCGGDAPSVPDTSVLKTVRDAVLKGGVTVTDVSRGGLIGALASFAPDCEIELKGDLMTELFAESYGRFVFAYENESDLPKGAVCIGSVKEAGFGMKIHGSTDVVLKASDISGWFNATTKLMRTE